VVAVGVVAGSGCWESCHSPFTVSTPPHTPRVVILGRLACQPHTDAIQARSAVGFPRILLRSFFCRRSMADREVERNAALNRIQDNMLCVRNELQNFHWQDVCREFKSLVRLVDELRIQLGRLPASYKELLDDLDTALRVTDKKSLKAMSKPNAVAFQELKTHVKNAADNHLDIIDECKEEAVENVIGESHPRAILLEEEKISGEDCKEEMETVISSEAEQTGEWISCPSSLQNRKRTTARSHSTAASNPVQLPTAVSCNRNSGVMPFESSGGECDSEIFFEGKQVRCFCGKRISFESLA